MKSFRTVTLAAAAVAWLGAQAHADSVKLTGPTSNASTYTTAQLQALAGGNTVTDGTLVGIRLWDLLGGADAGNTAVVWGNITTSTPATDNGKNAILHYYVRVTDNTGKNSVVSLGEIEPNFGGTANNTSAPAFIAFKTTGGTLLNDPQLIVPNASGRNVADVQKLELLSVPTLPNGPIVPSTSLALTGFGVTSPGIYSLAQLQGMPTSSLTISGNTYTGVSLWTFLNPLLSGTTDRLVIAKGMDGYEVVYSLAELDPSLGGNPLNLLPYADTGTDLPANGIARTILPWDTVKRGRWMSDLYELQVVSVQTPLPASWTLMLLGLAGLGWVKRRQKNAGSAR